MGTINYLVNHKQKKIFVLGKMLSGYDIAEIKNENDLLEYLKKQFQSEWFNIPNSDEYAENLVRSIINSIGLDDNVNMNDCSNDELYTTCSDYIVVGSFYLNDVDVGKPFYIKNDH